MLKSELLALAAEGARKRLADIERELARLQYEFPAIFASAAPIILLAAERRPGREAASNGNGHAPATAAVEAEVSKQRAAWTPARRAEQARRMKALQRAGKARGGKHSRKTAAQKAYAKEWGKKWYARLKRKGAERLSASSEGLGAKSASLLTSSRAWLEGGAIVKQKDGTYAAGDAPLAPAE